MRLFINVRYFDNSAIARTSLKSTDSNICTIVECWNTRFRICLHFCVGEITSDENSLLSILRCPKNFGLNSVEWPNVRMTDESEKFKKNMLRLNRGASTEFARNDWVKIRKTSLRIASVPNWTARHLPNKSLRCNGYKSPFGGNNMCVTDLKSNCWYVLRCKFHVSLWQDRQCSVTQHSGAFT